MLWFEDVSAINEPVLSFPVFGRISMKQFFVLGIAGMISYGLFSVTHGIASAVPIGIGTFLTFVRPRVGSPEWMIISIILFLAGRRAVPKTLSGEKPRERRASKTSKRLYLPDRFAAIDKRRTRNGLVEIKFTFEIPP